MTKTYTDVGKGFLLKVIRSNPSSRDEPNKRRLLGAYYTPVEIATSLSKWALAQDITTVLDPSFGGCAFLKAATAVLGSKGIRQPGRLVFGIDIDEECSKYVQEEPDLVTENCVYRDFLACSPDDLPIPRFGAVVGNPPFVRHHWLKGAAQAAARASLRNSGISLPMTASSWAYFLMHSLRFIADEGRLAMLVPEAILQTAYGAAVREVLSTRFRDVRLIHIRNRIFNGTDEPVVVVAASGYGYSGTLSVESIQCASELDEMLEIDPRSLDRTLTTTVNGRAIDTETIDFLSNLWRNPKIQSMNQIAIARVGFVTGANKHFILSVRELESFRVPTESFRPVVASSGWLSGLEFTQIDHDCCVRHGKKAYLVYPEDFSAIQALGRWISTGEQLGICGRQKCMVRDPWFRVSLPPEPHAFATCSRQGSPLLVLNRTGYSCSNALHGVRWRDKSGTSPEAIAIGFLTSLSSVWAELHGRRYGGGVLKLEPSALGQLPVPIYSGVQGEYTHLDGLLRTGCEEEARARADRLVLGQGLGLSDREIQQLQRARRSLMEQRCPVRDGVSHA